MKIINYLSNLAIPLLFLIILFFGIKERKNIFDLFLNGAKNGIKIAFNIFPTLIGVFLAVEVFRNSGIIDLIIKIISPVTTIIGLPKEIIPLAIIRPISGSASIAVGTDIMRNHGVDSKIGLIVSTIMGSTETTFYIISVYTSGIQSKKTGFILWSALIGDAVSIAASVVFWRILS